ncbi:hypothetical protein [Synechocystis sp. PCC 7509]|uniref:hypothetical protein n=1 Tax=Synechocystis sp. PCC 7509 TaxID=927677 RepID=UPI0011DDD514|nr:hypothetical protein [Synechocystis sp. PCC 7509]
MNLIQCDSEALMQADRALTSLDFDTVRSRFSFSELNTVRSRNNFSRLWRSAIVPNISGLTNAANYFYLPNLS